jgi:hypothetical protein
MSEQKKHISEREVVHAIRLALGPHLELNVNILQGTVVTASGATSKAGLGEGTPDLVGILPPHGRTFAIEAKAATGRVSPEQVRCHKRWRAAGAFVAVVKAATTEEAKQMALDALARAKQGASE